MLKDNIGMSIGSRIKEARKAAGLTQKALAQKVGMAQATLSELETGESQGTTLIASFAAALGVNALWLETGAGKMEPNAGGRADENFGLPPGTFKRVEAVGDDDPRLTMIPRVKLRLSAGINGFEMEPERFDGSTGTVPTDWMLKHGYSRDSLIMISVKGESMEPSLYEGDSVVINTADKRPVDGAVFAVNYEGEPVIKRFSRDAGRWWLMSDNPDQRKFHRKVCEGDACIIIGRIVRKESERI